MKRRYNIYFVLIALLLAANLARVWWVSEKGSKETVAHSKVFLPGDFRLHVDAPGAGEPYRNLFQAQGETRKSAPHSRPAKVKAVMPPPLKLEKTENEQALDRLGRLKLLGVVFRAGKGQAYLSQDKESVIALPGDTVFGQFVINKINVDAVELKDLKTNTIRRIPVSGK